MLNNANFKSSDTDMGGAGSKHFKLIQFCIVVTVCSSPVSAPLCQLATPPHQTKLPTPVSASFYRLPRLLIRPSLHTCDSLAAFKPAPVSASVPDCLVLCLIFQWFPPDWSPVVDLVCPWPACLVPVLDTTAAFCLWPRVWSPVADLVCPWPACLVSVLDTTAALCLWPRVRLFPPSYSPARLRGYTAHPVFLCCTWVLTIPVTVQSGQTWTQHTRRWIAWRR